MAEAPCRFCVQRTICQKQAARETSIGALFALRRVICCDKIVLSWAKLPIQEVGVKKNGL
nr:hypothetical protein [uncultured Agathobaculum sp.]